MSKDVFEGGATSTSQAGRYDLIPKAALDALARRFELGAAKHGENNWRAGGEAFRKSRISHLMQHLAAYAEHGNDGDENTAAIIWGAAVLCHFEAQNPFKGADTHETHSSDQP